MEAIEIEARNCAQIGYVLRHFFSVPRRGVRHSHQGPRRGGHARRQGEAEALLQEAGGLHAVRRGAFHATRGASGPLAQGIRGHRHDAEGTFRLSKKEI